MDVKKRFTPKQITIVDGYPTSTVDKVLIRPCDFGHRKCQIFCSIIPQQFTGNQCKVIEKGKAHTLVN